MKRVLQLSALVALGAFGLLLGIGGGALHTVAAIAQTGTGGPPPVPLKDNLYAAAFSAHGVTHFTIGASGALHNEDFTLTGDRALWNVAMSPDGRHLYAADWGGTDISVFDVQDDGTLVHNANHFDTDGRPRTIAVSPDGRNLYVAESNGQIAPGDVGEFQIAADGSLTRLGQVDAGVDPYGLAISPDGSSVYVTLQGTGQVEMYDRSSEDGTLTPKSPEFASAGDGNAEPDSIVLTPDGKYAYVANYNESSIAAFKVGDGGTLDAVATYGSGYGVYQLAMSPDGLSLYAPADCDTGSCVGDIWQYTIDPATGTLTTKTAHPVPMQFNASNMWLTADGTSAYVSSSKFNTPNNVIEQFDVAPDGTLTAKAEAPAPADSDPSGVVIPADQGPTASFTAVPGAPGGETAFDATGSSDVDGSIAEYDWSFGDGTTAIDAGTSPSHVYASAGTYTVTLHVTDDAGCSTTSVFTGQSAYCHGNPAAEVQQQVTIGAGATTSTTAPTTTAGTTTGPPITLTGPGTTTITVPTPLPTTTEVSPPPPPPPVTTTVPSATPFGTLELGQFAVARSAAMRHSLWLDALAALPNTITATAIKSIDWSANGFDWQCDGYALATSISLPRTGTYDVGLKVTTTGGQVATTEQRVYVTPDEVSFDSRSPIFDCEDPGANAQPDRSDCVKSFSFGLLDINSQGHADDCFQITSRFTSSYIQEGIHHEVLPRSLQRSQNASIWVYHATIKGPVLVNGLYIPVPEDVTSEYDSGTLQVGLGTHQLRFGSYRTVSIPLDLRVVPDSSGKYNLGDIDLSGAIPKIGGLKSDAKVSVDFFYRQTRITFHLGLPNIFHIPGSTNGPQASLVVFTQNGGGFTVDGGTLGPTDVYIGPLLVKGLQFSYSARDDTWSGGAQVWIPGAPIGIDAAPPPPDKGFGMKHGEFDHAGIGVTFPPTFEPMVFPGLFLKHLDVAIGVNPLRFTGSAGFDAAHVADIDGEVFVAFATPDDPYTIPADAGDLAPISGRTLTNFSIAIGGTVSIKIPVIDNDVALYNGYLLYEYPSLFEFAGGFNLDYYYLKIDGGLKGFLDGDSGRWSMEGGIHACLQHIVIAGIEINPCDSVGGVISSKGIAFCTTFPLPIPPFGFVVPVPVGAGYSWDGSFTPMIFDCDYGPWRETVPTAFRSLAAAIGPQRLVLPATLPAASIRITGATGAPDATITKPDGTKFSTAGPLLDPNVEVLKLARQKATYVAIKKPAGGTWTVTPSAATPVTGVASASGEPTAQVRASVTAAGRARTLHYSLTAAPGRVVTFAERGPQTYHMLGQAHGAHGSIVFRPADGRAGRRQIVALVVENGVQVAQTVVATYAAPAPLRPGRPTQLRTRHDGSTLVVTWRRAPHATHYLTTLTVGGHVWQSVVTARSAVRLGNIYRREHAVVAVRAIGKDGRPGRPVQRRV